jgi:hypothetical protein
MAVKAVDKFDGVLLSIAQECEGGVQEMLDVIFSFLARKTDFYTGSTESAAENLVMDKFRKHGATAREEKARKKAENEEKDRKMRERRQKEEIAAARSEDAKICEVTEEEARKIEQEEMEKKKEATAPKAAELPEAKAEQEEEDEDEKGKLKPNARNGADLPKYSWGQTLEEIELRVPLGGVYKVSRHGIYVPRARYRIHKRRNHGSIFLSESDISRPPS